jgi:hypothetical protein
MFKIWFYIARYLPLPRLSRLAWQRRLVEAAYENDIQAAQANGDESGIEIIRHDAYYETSMLDDEVASIRSIQLVAAARKFQVMLPPMRDENGEVSQDWEEGKYGFRWTLSDVGRMKVREEIRKEKKAQHDDRVRWLAWITPVIGVAGIAATILTRK